MKADMHRRQFLSATASAFAALSLSGCMTRGPALANFDGYGPLVPDPEGLLDLPEGFSYRLLSSLGDVMSDGGTVPDKAAIDQLIARLDRQIVLVDINTDGVAAAAKG